MVEYAGLDFGKLRSRPIDRLSFRRFPGMTAESQKLLQENLGPLSAIGEQKATQLFAQLASRLDKGAAASYKAIFSAWGGDVRDRSIDLESGRLRPREYTVAKDKKPNDLLRTAYVTGDPTVYARVDYFDEKAKLSPAEKTACKTVLKNLPVVFTFAPMNLLHYQVSFPAGSTKSVVVKYKQYPYEDTRGTGSYQLAYVLHPATLWNDFGPIHLKVNVPEGVKCLASVPIGNSDRPQPAANAAAVQRGQAGSTAPVRQQTAAIQPARPVVLPGSANIKFTTYVTTLNKRAEKSGELFIALDKAGWKTVTTQTVAAARPPRP